MPTEPKDISYIEMYLVSGSLGLNEISPYYLPSGKIEKPFIFRLIEYSTGLDIVIRSPRSLQLY